jgi:protein involved in polysaccharide export with SLBB domain
MRISNLWRLAGRWAGAASALVGALVIAGCGSDGTQQFADLSAANGNGTAETGAAPPGEAPLYAAAVIHAGEAIEVTFSDLTPPVNPIDMRVKDDGTITLLFNEVFSAVGKTTSELEKEIRARYVPKYYVNLTVNVRQLEQFYFVGGQVKQPNRYPYAGPTTVTKAIQSAGDFTDFANKKKIKLTRPDGTSSTINWFKAQDDPRLDLPVFPGDKIHVPQRIF